MTKYINDETFSDEVVSSDKPVMVDFTANWCPPCKVVSPIVDRLATEFDGKVKVLKLDIDTAPEVVKEFGVKSIPTFIFFQSGKEVDRWLGAGKNESAFREKLNSLSETK